MIKKYKMLFTSILFGLMYLNNLNSLEINEKKNNQDIINRKSQEFYDSLIPEVIASMGSIEVDNNRTTFQKIIELLEFSTLYKKNIINPIVEIIEDPNKSLQTRENALDKLKTLITNQIHFRNEAFIDIWRWIIPFCEVNNLKPIPSRDPSEEAAFAEKYKSFFENNIPIKMIENKYNFINQKKERKEKFEQFSFEIIKYFKKEQIQALPLSLFNGKYLEYEEDSPHYISFFERYAFTNLYNKIPYLNLSKENQAFLTNQQLEAIYNNDGFGLEIFNYLLNNKILDKNTYNQYNFIEKLSDSQKKIWNKWLQKDCEKLLKYIYQLKIGESPEEFIINNTWTWTDPVLWISPDTLKLTKEQIASNKFKNWNNLPRNKNRQTANSKYNIQEIILTIASEKFPSIKNNIFGKDYSIINDLIEDNLKADKIMALNNALIELLKESIGESAATNMLGFDYKKNNPTLERTKTIIDKFKFSKYFTEQINTLFKNKIFSFEALETIIIQALEERRNLLYAKAETIIRTKAWKNYTNKEKKGLIKEILPKEAFMLAVKHRSSNAAKRIAGEVLHYFGYPALTPTSNASPKAPQ